MCEQKPITLGEWLISCPVCSCFLLPHPVCGFCLVEGDVGCVERWHLMIRSQQVVGASSVQDCGQ